MASSTTRRATAAKSPALRFPLARVDRGLDDNDHVKCLGDDEWHNVGELRSGIHQDDDRALAAECAPPDPYAEPLQTLRAAAATPLSTFESQWKASRLRDLEAEAAAVVAEVAAVPRMTAAEEAELASYAPPSPYAAGIKALRAKRTR